MNSPRIVLLILLLFVLGCRQQTARDIINLDFEDLPEASSMEIVELSNGSSFSLEARMVQRGVGGKMTRMYGYNGQIPGPVLRVKQNSTVTIEFTNSLDLPTTVHWHGIRVENAYDGVPDVTQSVVDPGASFTYHLRFPDEGVYWYHPHVREDAQQDLGLYGMIIVDPIDQQYFTPNSDEDVLFLDDIRLFEGRPEPYLLNEVNYALMGRFGNTMLVNGETQYHRTVSTGTFLRFYVLNVASVRVFNFSIPGIPFTINGFDSGLPIDTIGNSVTLAPSERAIVELAFSSPGEYPLIHSTPDKQYTLGTITVTGPPVVFKPTQLRERPTVSSSIERLRPFFDRAVDLELALDAELQGMGDMAGHMHSNQGIEWEDTMVMMNLNANKENTRWILRDTVSGKENMNIPLTARVGDVKKIRLKNADDGAHPMQHPIHLHGQRFLILSQDGFANNDLTWKDTVLVPAGSIVDILVEFTNPGKWMMHCHIPEHMEAGMMALWDVKP